MQHRAIVVTFIIQQLLNVFTTDFLKSKTKLFKKVPESHELHLLKIPKKGSP